MPLEEAGFVETVVMDVERSALVDLAIRNHDSDRRVCIARAFGRYERHFGGRIENQLYKILVGIE